MTEIKLWEILVPQRWPNGEKISLDKHISWDESVIKIVGGLTLLPIVSGRWEDRDKADTGSHLGERMIPVRIAATKAQIVDIADETLRQFNQFSVMYYRVSNEVYFYK